MIDFNDPAFVENPYPALKELRTVGQPVWHEGLQMFLAARLDLLVVLRARGGRLLDSSIYRCRKVFRQPARHFHPVVHPNSCLDASVLIRR